MSTALFPRVDGAALLNASSCLLETYRNIFNKAHSLNGEEYLLLPTLLAATLGQPGVFVELGAFDGIILSNTVVLERCFQWSGLLIEGNPSNFHKLLRSNRVARKVHSAICEGNGSATVRFTSAGGPVAGQLNQLTDKHQAEWAKVNRPKKSVDVRCQSLRSIMSAGGMQEATFLSLDVEGAEATVLGTVRPSAFKVILVEADGDDLAKETIVEQIIVRDGLRHAPELNVSHSRVYLRSDVTAFPLPKSMTRANRFPDRIAPAWGVNSDVLTRLLTQVLGSQLPRG